MGYMASFVKEVSQPTNLAELAAGVVETNLPAMTQATEAMIKRETPRMIEFVGDTVSREVPLLLRNMVEKATSDYSGKLAVFAVGKYSEAFDAVVTGTRTDIERAVQTDIDTDREKFIRQALDKQLEMAIQNLGKGQMGDDPLFQKIEESHVALGNLNKRLRTMSKADPKKMGRRDQLTKRFLGTFWRFIQQENPDVLATDEGDGGAKKAKGAKKGK
jgi:hypothetical protein